MSDCTCDKVEMELIAKQLKDGIITVRGMGYYRDGVKLYEGDSWGFRTKVPGECENCYQTWKKNYESQEWD
jgi:hypothetical protein